MTVSAQFARAARGIETASSEEFELSDSIFTGGLVDVLLSQCNVGIDAIERSRLAAFAVRSVLDSRGNVGSGNFDQAFSDAFEGSHIYVAGGEAAGQLKCAEPVSTQLLKNVVAMLSNS